MAGKGKKTFVAGEILIAQDVNEYLMDQTVMNFASSAARSSAIPTPTQGMISYQTNTDAIEAYNGSNWVTRVSKSVPFATNQGTVNIVFAAAGQQSVSVTFAASRFTQAPLVQVTPNAANAEVTATSGSVTTSGFSVFGYSPGGATRTFHWSAVQMTSAASAG
jgi:hypothetical protein